MNIKEILLKNKNKGILIDTGTIYSSDCILDKVADHLKSGIKIIQFYVKNFTDKQNIETAFKLRQLCSIFDALLIINSRVDIAQLVKADGICLFDDDMSIFQAKELLHDDLIIGINTNKLQNALEAQQNNADYISIEPCAYSSLKDNIKALNKIKIIELDRQII